MKKISLLTLALTCLFSFSAYSQLTPAPGDYSLRAKMGPSFALQDAQDQFRLGGELDYELGFSMGLNFLALMGFNEDEFRFQMIPSFRYDYLYIGPASFHGLLGMGLGVIDTQSTLDFRLGTGVILPLGDYYEFSSDLNLFMSPAGTAGNPISFEWLIGFGVKFN